MLISNQKKAYFHTPEAGLIVWSPFGSAESGGGNEGFVKFIP